MIKPASRLLILLVGLACSARAASAPDPLGPEDAPPRPPIAATIPVTEDLWGKQVTDPYRYMEALDPPTLDWIKAEGAYTRSVLDAIRPRAALEARIAKLTGSFGMTQGYAIHCGRAFYLERAAGSDAFDLVVSDQAGKRKLIDVSSLHQAKGGMPYSIDYFSASPDGSRVAAGISEGGSEATSLSVYDAESGKLIAGPVDRTDPGYLAWGDDSKHLYFPRLKQLAPGGSEDDKYRNPTLVAWDLHRAPVSLFGSTVRHGPHLLPDELPTLALAPGSPVALATSINGMQPELAVWLAPVKQIHKAHVRWKSFITREDGIVALEAGGGRLFLLSHKNAPTFQVLAVKAGQPLTAARIIVPARPDRVIDAIHPASDGLYVLARHGAYSQLLHVLPDTGRTEEIPLPFEGHIGESFTDPRQPGITIALESFVVPPSSFHYDPAARHFSELQLGEVSQYDPGRYEISDLEAQAEDGVLVPETLVLHKGSQGPQILLMQAYGAYGISQLASFSARTASFLEAGGSYASCHVRGGGELGEGWRLGGKDANKPHSWRDLIACAEDLIRRGLTTRDQLFILSGSAGGITVGRALTERPDLFAGVIALAPGANPLRGEFSPTGPLNIPEFGTIQTEQGFRNLYAMDTLQHVATGVAYPPVLVTTGLNDPRVLPWEPAKLVATLQASDTSRPILLRVDAEAGHGVGSSKGQEDALYADLWAFVFWRAGLPEWRPHFTAK